MSETVHGNIQSEETIVGRADKPEIVIGLSAYEIAVKHGFVGTEEEWNALIAMKTDLPARTSQLQNDSAFVNEQQLAAVREIARLAGEIAQGKNQSHTFDTEDELDEWLLNPDNVASLGVGDNLFIRETDVPDYWWDGEQKQQLETQKVVAPKKVSELQNDAGYLTEDTMPRELFVATVKTTWDELKEAYNAGKDIVVDNNGSRFVLSVPNMSNNPPYMSFTTFNNATKELNALDINERDKKWTFTKNLAQECFVVAYNSTTFAEVQKAFNAGKRIECKYNVEGGVWARLPLVKNMGDSHFTFKGFTMWQNTKRTVTCVLNSNGWTVEEEDLLSENDIDPLKEDIDTLKRLTLGIVGGGIGGGNDIPAGGTFSLVPNTILFCLSSEKSKLNLKGTEELGSTVNKTGYTALLIFATVLDSTNTKFNICGIGVGGSSILNPTMDSFRYIVNKSSPLYVENIGSSSAGLYRDMRVQTTDKSETS